MANNDDKDEKPRKKTWLTDDEGNPSAIRFLSALAFLGAVGFAYVVATSEKGTEQLDLVLYFLVAAFAPKTVQKFAEKWTK